MANNNNDYVVDGKIDEKSKWKQGGELTRKDNHKKEKIVKPMKLTPNKFIYSLPHWQRDATPIATVNCTSKSQEEWSRGLSPFNLGPVDLYKNYQALNVENAWQFSKVYTEHLNETGDPSDEWWQWAKTGWSNPKAERSPMGMNQYELPNITGRGATREYSYWDGHKYKYIDARYTFN